MSKEKKKTSLKKESIVDSSEKQVKNIVFFCLVFYVAIFTFLFINAEIDLVNAEINLATTQIECSNLALLANIF